MDMVASQGVRDHYGTTSLVRRIDEALRRAELGDGSSGGRTSHRSISYTPLEKLIDRLMRAAIEHAGAEGGLLVLPRGVELTIHAQANISGNSVMVHLHEAPISAAELPESVARYAARTQESVILDDASAANPFSSDDYIRHRRARSVLCLPLMKQGVLVALLYLENNLAPNVFTPDRIAALKLLASEAAMSLDNSRLYRELEEREAKIRRLVDANIMGSSSPTWTARSLRPMMPSSRCSVIAGTISWRDDFDGLC
jgi:GAF domain-containing protein